jgi:diguanylate cyclase (GGDEF)-like protein
MEGDLAAGSRPIRLVRLRLILALVAMAFLPLAVGAPLALTALDGQQAADQLRVERDSSSIATNVDGRLERIGQALATSGVSGAISGYAGGSKAALAEARTVLATLATGTADGILEATLLDVRGRQLLRAVDGHIVKLVVLSSVDPLIGAALEAGRGAVVRDAVRQADDGTARIAMATPVLVADGTARSIGVVRIELAIDRILATAQAQVDGAGASFLVDASGATLASASAAGSSSIDPVRRAGATVAQTTDLGGYPGWAIRVVAPTRFAPPPLPLVGFLGLIVLVLGILIAWLARQVLRPAEELESSRARLHDRYELARVDALRDVITGLGNHRAFQEEFERQVEAARIGRDSLSLVLIDLDDFKAVNDNGGHAAGDDTLAFFGKIVEGILRTGDRAFRTGGDEFALILPGFDAGAADAISRRLLSTALDRRPGRGATPPLSFSAGISTFPNPAANRRQLQAQADAALAWAKRHGRTTTEVFDPQRHRGAQAVTSVAEQSTAVAEAIAGRLLRPVFQPIVDLRSGRVVGYEGLVRPLPASGFTDPGSMFDAAEAVGRTVELDVACLEIVAAGAAGLIADSMLTINLSPRTLESEEFSARFLESLVRRAGIEPSRVVLEITEREQIEEMERLRRNVAACRKVGFRLAADDVGAGNAGLRLLSQLQFDIVKIDLSLVQSGAIHEASLSVVGALQDLARRWGATVIAEGIETPEQLRVVRELEIASGQGYLLGRPGSAEDLLTIAMTAVDIDGLLGRDDWLHRLALGQGSAARAAVH